VADIVNWGDAPPSFVEDNRINITDDL